jgi:beta-glucosidase
LDPFPTDFRWGVSTSSFQIEGATEEDGRGESVWDMFSRRAGSIAGNGSANVACDHYHRWQEDVDWLARLGVNAYRLSVAWPRVLPEGTGRAEPRGLDFYDRLVDKLLGKGIEPWVTLYHWDFPLALFHRGGWLNRDSASWFADYAELVVRRLSDRATHWITLNEPQVFVGEGHCHGRHAPGLRLPWKEALLAGHHSLLAHGYAVEAIRSSALRTPSVGYAPAGPISLPASNRPEDVAIAYAESVAVSHQSIWNMAWWLDPVVFGRYPADGIAAFGAAAPIPAPGDMEFISSQLDFLGLNLYWGPRVDATHRGRDAVWSYPAEHPHTAFGWAIVPEIMHWGPRFMAKRYGLPIVITENGISCLDSIATDGHVHDSGRMDFINRHLAMLRSAITVGVNVLGYFHWSLLDNFEWADGYEQRFGLLHTDFTSGERTPKDSFHHYRDIIAAKANNLPAESLGINEPGGWETVATT